MCCTPDFTHQPCAGAQFLQNRTYCEGFMFSKFGNSTNRLDVSMNLSQTLLGKKVVSNTIIYSNYTQHIPGILETSVNHPPKNTPRNQPARVLSSWISRSLSPKGTAQQKKNHLFFSRHDPRSQKIIHPTHPNTSSVCQPVLCTSLHTTHINSSMRRISSELWNVFPHCLQSKWSADKFDHTRFSNIDTRLMEPWQKWQKLVCRKMPTQSAKGAGCNSPFFCREKVCEYQQVPNHCLIIFWCLLSHQTLSSHKKTPMVSGKNHLSFWGYIPWPH